MKLAQLAEGLNYTLVQGSLEEEITNVRYDTRAITGGEVFVCICVYSRDSHDMAAQAVEQGAKALLIQHDLEQLPEGHKAGSGPDERKLFRPPCRENDHDRRDRHQRQNHHGAYDPLGFDGGRPQGGHGGHHRCGIPGLFCRAAEHHPAEL